jgi:REP element-mobilizing transposase RayT
VSPRSVPRAPNHFRDAFPSPYGVGSGPPVQTDRHGPALKMSHGETVRRIYLTGTRDAVMDWLNEPLAYHITFGTYGTRLHGDARGTVDRTMNQPGDPIIGSDPALWKHEHNRMNFPPVELDAEKMSYAQSLVPAICERGKWKYHTCAAGPDHVHIVLTTKSDGQAVRKWVKRWLGEGMSLRWPLPEGATWWAEGGSVKWIWKQDYFENVYGYVHRQRAR